MAFFLLSYDGLSMLYRLLANWRSFVWEVWAAMDHLPPVVNPHHETGKKLIARR